MARGGRRTGASGTAYSNRTDLNPAHKLPITTATGQPYGEAAQQAAAQAAVPEASGQLGGPDLSAATSAATAFQPPNVIPGSAPTMRPNEPVTTPPSMPVGPVGGDPLLNGVALLNSLGANASPEVKALRAAVSASQSNAAAP